MSVPPPMTDAPSAVAHLLSHRFLGAGMGAVAALFCALLPFTDAGERAELRTHDVRFALRERFPHPTRARIVLVTAQASTLAAWQEPTLFWGARYAKIITVTRKHGAKVIGVDSVFAASADDALTQAGTDGSFAPDETLAQAIEAANGSVVLAFLLGTGSEPTILPAPRFLLLPALENRLGFIDLEPAADYAIRTARARVRGKSNGESVAASSFAAVLAQSATPAQTASPRSLPDAPFYINYTGRDFPTIAAERVASDTLRDAERDFLRGATVIIAKDYAPSLDRHVASGGRVMSGAAIHAQTLATLLDNRPLRRFPVAGEAAGTLLLAILTGSVAWRSASARRSLAFLVAALLLLAVTAVGAFFGTDLLLPLAAPALACVLPTLLVRAARSVEEAFARLSIEATFGRHVSPVVRDYLLRSPKNLRLGGEEYEATIVFFDIRGSTRYCESHDPQTVVRDFNDLYTVAIGAIESHGGVVNHFLGDGFLAVWGFPVDATPGHAQGATDGCLAALRAVARFNETERLPRNLSAWRVGISVHSGTVLGGNIGIASRTEFTFMGDVVNTAAHMEKFNKQFGTQMVISDTTLSRLTETPPLLPDAGFLPGRPTLPVWGVAESSTKKEGNG